MHVSEQLTNVADRDNVYMQSMTLRLATVFGTDPTVQCVSQWRELRARWRPCLENAPQREQQMHVRRGHVGGRTAQDRVKEIYLSPRGGATRASAGHGVTHRSHSRTQAEAQHSSPTGAQPGAQDSSSHWSSSERHLRVRRFHAGLARCRQRKPRSPSSVGQLTRFRFTVE